MTDWNWPRERQHHRQRHRDPDGIGAGCAWTAEPPGTAQENAADGGRVVGHYHPSRCSGRQRWIAAIVLSTSRRQPSQFNIILIIVLGQV